MQKIDSIVWEAEQAAVNSTARLRELQGGGSDDVAEAAAAAHELSLEKDTWALLLKMSGDDHLNRAIEDEVRREPLRYSAPGPNASDQHVLDAMRHRDPEFRRTEAVVEWLQGAMKARLDELAPAEGIVRGGGLGWSHTLESLAVGGGQKSEVAQMHPDANLQKVSRSSGRVEMVGDALQVMRLVGQDDIDEEELMRTVWVLVRAGEMRRARVLCENRGQPWRAAAMAGGAVVGSRGENHGEEDGAVYSPGQALWQEMCWKLRWGGGWWLWGVLRLRCRLSRGVFLCACVCVADVRPTGRSSFESRLCPREIDINTLNRPISPFPSTTVHTIHHGASRTFAR